MKSRLISTMVITLASTTPTFATEPNETIETATVLAPGVLIVADDLSPNAASFPDTLMGIRDHFGEIYYVDDDGSPIGDGTASGSEEVSTNSGSIDFAVTGCCDDSFVGDHSQAGKYRVFVNVYDFFDDLVDQFTEDRTLAPGVVHDFFYSDSNWINGSYDVYIDNTIGVAIADVDFFTFSGLPARTRFSARTADPTASGINTLLGWFDSTGSLLDADDGGAGGNLSLIEGTIPDVGTLTFAVTGVGDDNFSGAHSERGEYELRIQLQVVGLVGDYNGNNIVDAADYVLWRKTLGQSGAGLEADGNNNNEIDAGDYEVWRTNFGNTSGANPLMSRSIPEPSTILSVIFGVVVMHHMVSLRRRLVRA